VQDGVQDAGTDERLTVAEAADRLGITKEAVRKRIHRGTLRSDNDADGTVRVYVPPYDAVPGVAAASDRDLLYEEMRERIAYLERQIEEEREARRHADTLLTRLMNDIPALEAPQQPPGALKTAAGEPQRGNESPARPPEAYQVGYERPRDTAEFPVGGSLTRPWWRRVFGG
jgi:excisionase family DNA binding protein